MGRYYKGDIQGKFWFAVQSSNDANFFGGEENEITQLQYSFTKEDLKSIKKGIVKCEKELGDYKGKLDKFFKEHNGYNDDMLVKEFSITEIKVKTLLEWYARLILGNKIKKCVEQTGYCIFEAEL